MNTFKAAVLVKSNSLLEIRELKFPKELQPGQVLVEMNTAALCGSQLGEISAIKGVDKFLPHLLGHEGIGPFAGFEFLFPAGRLGQAGHKVDQVVALCIGDAGGCKHAAPVGLGDVDAQFVQGDTLTPGMRLLPETARGIILPALICSSHSE